MLAVLLPPSEGKASGGTEPGWQVDDGVFGEALARPRRVVARALRVAKGGDEKLLGIGGAGLEQARAANRSLEGAPCLPAWQRFTGVVWEHLSVPTLSPAGRVRASQSIVVICAVAGLAALDDPLPDHRLKLGVSLGRPGRLAPFWRTPLSRTLNDHLAQRLVIDLLPNEHAAAWLPDPDRYDLRRVRFVSRDGKPGGHAAKAAKGLLARSLVESESPERVLARWRHDDFDLHIS